MGELQDAADHVIIAGRGRVITDSPVSALLGRWPSLEAAYLALTRDAVEYRGAPEGRPPSAGGGNPAQRGMS
jgi:ABC-2 type transport system ATP-binding protein